MKTNQSVDCLGNWKLIIECEEESCCARRGCVISFLSLYFSYNILNNFKFEYVPPII